MIDYDMSVYSETPNYYHELTDQEKDKINEIKFKAQEIGELVSSLKDNDRVDQEWVEVGKIDIQKGFMALVRSVAKPEAF